MALNNVAIFNCLNNYIDKNKQGVSNWIHVHNTDPVVNNPIVIKIKLFL